MEVSDLSIDWAIASQPFEEGSESGDMGAIKPLDSGFAIVAVDVAGHGAGAASLANAIRVFFERSYELAPVEFLSALDGELKGTRGCVGVFGRLGPQERVFRYASVGNVQGVVFGEHRRRLVSQDGIIGYTMPKLRERQIAIESGECLVLYSDGIREYFDPDPSLVERSASAGQIASGILDTFGKGVDDALCLALKLG